jgi:DNA-binding SARP family transcriptional activator
LQPIPGEEEGALSPIVHLRLLGGFALEIDGAQVPVTSPRLRALLALLALQRSEPQSRRRLAFLLWPDSTEAQAHTNLRTLLHRLQTALPGAEQVLQLDQHAIGWRDGIVLEFDVASFVRALVAAEADPPASSAAVCAALERAVEQYRGDLLPDSYDEWLLLERERLRQLFLESLARLVTVLDERREYARAVEHARRLVQLDPLNEAAALSLLRLHAQAGDRASALRVYHACASRLKAELGAEPGRALRSAYDQLRASEAPVTETPAALPLVGREAEWRRLQAAWQGMVAGRPRLLILSGEAGIGKTRLAEELARWIGRQGDVAVAAHCYAAEGSLPYAPVVSWLRSDALRRRLSRLEAHWRAELGRLAPELIGDGARATRTTSLSEAWQRQHLFEALARAVDAVDRPLLLLLDDIQWCDRDTLEWLHFLLRFETRSRLLVVATLRIEELDEAHQTALLLDSLRREGRLAQIGLGPLSRGEAAELAASVMGQVLGSGQQEQVYAETEGNPLFVVEMARAGMFAAERAVGAGRGSRPATSTAFGRDGAALPPGVQAVVTRRLMQVSAPARELLRVAAVIGRSFTAAVLAHAADVDEDTLVRGLDELWQRRIVVEHGTDSYDFSHDKMRAAAYAALGPARRRLLHRRVAEALMAVYAADLDTVSGQVGPHYERAGLGAMAAAAFGRAAEVARRIYANDEALGHYRRAIALLEGTSREEAAGLSSRLGDLLHHLGRYDEARRAWEHVLACTPHADAMAGAELQRKIGNAWRDEGSYDEALAAYQRAGERLDQPHLRDQRAWQVWIELQLDHLQVYYWLGQWRPMQQIADTVRPAIQEHGTALQRARLHQLAAVIVWRRDRYGRARDAAEHQRAYLAALTEAGEEGMLPAAHFQLGLALVMTGDLDEAERELRLALDEAERRGDRSLEGRCLTYVTIVERKRGNLEQTRAHAERSLAVATSGHMHDYIGAAYGNLAWVAWRMGRPAEAAAYGERALDAWRSLPAGYMFSWVARWPLVGLALTEADIRAAVEHARAMLDERQQRPPPEIEPLLEAAVRTADASDIAAAREQLESACVPARELGYL